MKPVIKSNLIAPCGINCNVCRAHLRERNKCAGCLAKGHRLDHCENCKIRKCAASKHITNCSSCNDFPCLMIKKLDMRYRTRYGVSVIDNLRFIKDHGMKRFIMQQEKTFVKPDGILCMHDKMTYQNRS